MTQCILLKVMALFNSSYTYSTSRSIRLSHSYWTPVKFYVPAFTLKRYLGRSQWIVPAYKNCITSQSWKHEELILLLTYFLLHLIYIEFRDNPSCFMCWPCGRTNILCVVVGVQIWQIDVFAHKKPTRFVLPKYYATCLSATLIHK